MLIKNGTEKILWVFFLVTAFSAQAMSDDEKKPAVRPAPAVHMNQAAPHVEVHHSQSAPVAAQEHQESSVWGGQMNAPKPSPRPAPAVYTFHAQPSQSVPESNPPVAHHHHPNYWHPLYNYAGQQYSFYPYVNAAPSGDLSPGYVPLQYNDQTYYYDDGEFYRNQGDTAGYTAVVPPVGAVVPTLPSAVVSLTMNGSVYYLYNGVYYRATGHGYKVVSSPLHRGYRY